MSLNSGLKALIGACAVSVALLGAAAPGAFAADSAASDDSLLKELAPEWYEKFQETRRDIAEMRDAVLGFPAEASEDLEEFRQGARDRLGLNDRSPSAGGSTTAAAPPPPPKPPLWKRYCTTPASGRESCFDYFQLCQKDGDGERCQVQACRNKDIRATCGTFFCTRAAVGDTARKCSRSQNDIVLDTDTIRRHISEELAHSRSEEGEKNADASGGSGAPSEEAPARGDGADAGASGAATTPAHRALLYHARQRELARVRASGGSDAASGDVSYDYDGGSQEAAAAVETLSSLASQFQASRRANQADADMLSGGRYQAPQQQTASVDAFRAQPQRQAWPEDLTDVATGQRSGSSGRSSARASGGSRSSSAARSSGGSSGSGYRPSYVTVGAIDARYRAPTRANVGRIISAYGSIPGGVLLESAEPLKMSIKEVRLNPTSGEATILPGEIRYQLITEPSSLIYLMQAFVEDQRFGVTIDGGGPRVYGDVSSSSIIAKRTFVADLLLANFSMSSNWDYHRPDGGAPSGLWSDSVALGNVSYRFFHRGFEVESGKLVSKGIEFEGRFIPASATEKAADGGALPDYDAIERGDIPAHYQRNFEKLAENYEYYRTELAIGRTEAYAETASLARMLLANGVSEVVLVSGD